MDVTLSFIFADYVTYVVKRICEKHGLPSSLALRRFLFSKTYRMFSNPKMELWEYAPETIFELWECEQITGDPRNSIYIRGE